VRFRLAAMLAVIALGGGGALGASGCGTDYGDLGRECTPDEARAWGCQLCPYSCEHYAIEVAGDAGADAGDAGALGVTCEGECVPIQPTGWLGPLLLWMGPGAEVPTCPPRAPDSGGYAWYGDLHAPPATCGACTCDPPAGSCTLPMKLTASSSICAEGPGSHATVFDAPGGWSGACTAANGISKDEPCGSSPCVVSLTIAPLLVTEGPCTPASNPPLELPEPPTWGTFAETCQGTTAGTCDDASMMCTPASEPGFERCVYREGNWPCAMSPYFVRHVLYTGFSDTRGCDPCTCGDAAGSTCSAKVSVFSDLVCSALVGTFPIDATGPGCHDILPVGSALRSKSATPAIYEPGFCQPGGGGPIGAAEPLNPTTYCCLPEP
jgi:hypothetical protein